jgi:hypothetical protein
MIYFDDDGHVYSDGWNEIPGVTSVLASYFEIDTAFYTPGAAERGTRAHDLCAAYVAGERGELRDPYARAFAQWLFDSGAEPLESEQIIEGELGGMRYAGRYDLIVKLGGRRVLVDLKTGIKAKWHAAQVAAYSVAVKPPPARAAVLYLHRDETYRLEILSPGELAHGLVTFKAALAAWGQK